MSKEPAAASSVAGDDADGPTPAREVRLPYAYLVPTILVVVAVVQAVLTQTQDLTPWKGGGFGMFASVDRVEHRAVRVYLETQDGQVLAVPDYRRAGSQVKTLGRAAQAMPTDGLVRALAEEVGEVDWVAVATDGEPVAVPASDAASGQDLGSTVADLSAAEAVDVSAVRVEVLKLALASDDVDDAVEIVATRLADVTRPASS